MLASSRNLLLAPALVADGKGGLLTTSVPGNAIPTYGNLTVGTKPVIKQSVLLHFNQAGTYDFEISVNHGISESKFGAPSSKDIGWFVGPSGSNGATPLCLASSSEGLILSFPLSFSFTVTGASNSPFNGGIWLLGVKPTTSREILGSAEPVTGTGAVIFRISPLGMCDYARRFTSHTANVATVTFADATTHADGRVTTLAHVTFTSVKPQPDPVASGVSTVIGLIANSGGGAAVLFAFSPDGTKETATMLARGFPDGITGSDAAASDYPSAAVGLYTYPVAWASIAAADIDGSVWIGGASQVTATLAAPLPRLAVVEGSPVVMRVSAGGMFELGVALGGGAIGKFESAVPYGGQGLGVTAALYGGGLSGGVYMAGWCQWWDQSRQAEILIARADGTSETVPLGAWKDFVLGGAGTDLAKELAANTYDGLLVLSIDRKGAIIDKYILGGLIRDGTVRMIASHRAVTAETGSISDDIWLGASFSGSILAGGLAVQPDSTRSWRAYGKLIGRYPMLNFEAVPVAPEGTPRIHLLPRPFVGMPTLPIPLPPEDAPIPIPIPFPPGPHPSTVGPDPTPVLGDGAGPSPAGPPAGLMWGLTAAIALAAVGAAVWAVMTNKRLYVLLR